MRLLPWFVALLALWILPPPAMAQKTLILVRHAERDENNPEKLSEAGRLRAKALARTLKDTSITLVVRSDTVRTQETAAPTVQANSVPQKVVKYDEQHVENVVKIMKDSGDHAVVLYVGHSDTLEPLLRKLGYQGPFSLEDDPFGNLIILVPNAGGPKVIRLHYPKE